MEYKSIGHFGTAFRNLGRNSWMTSASIATVTVGLLIAGLVVMLIYNVNLFVSTVESELVIKVFLELDTTPQEREALEENLANHPLITDVRYVDKAEGMAILRQQFGDDAEVLDGLDLEALIWDGFEITTVDARQIAIVAEAITDLDHVEEVVYGREYISDILDATEMIKLIGLGLALAVGIASTFVIFNTIRLTVLMRHDEISIMRYVGATNWFIRWPFILEGWIIGICGALVASGVLIYAYDQFVIWLVEMIPYLQMVPVQTIAGQLVVILVGSGSVLGVLGSTLSMRRFLRL